MTSEQALLALTALNSAGLLPAAWALVRYVWNMDRRVYRLELLAGKAPAVAP